jgi:hypothetical protein
VLEITGEAHTVLVIGVGTCKPPHTIIQKEPLFWGVCLV